MRKSAKTLFAAIALLGCIGARPAIAAFPDKPITMIVPFPPGGPTDAVARVAANKAGQLLGQQIVVENRAGAAGAIGASAIARARPDGYTVGLATVSTHGTAPHLYADLAYDPIKDFTPLSNLAGSPNILSVHPDFPAKTLKEFAGIIKSNPGKYSYANAGAGGVNDLGMIWFLQEMGGSMVSVPYRGSAPALTDTIGGTIPVIFDNYPSSLPYIQSGRLRALAITGTERNPQLPSLPTFQEEGYKDYNVTSWYGLVAPAGLPADVTQTLSRVFADAVNDPETAQKLAEAGAFPIGNTSDEFSAQIERELNLWRDVIQKGNFKLQ
ncbi:tripartite tricarboxylate transporter substrate binding protein BugE [Paracandidimonas soli]|uniref:Tripartite-type tricarboxylate transporter receptor subunit TctC n=1 Tax=Paracandidimonas soli TaxID=1917182 RepID=A0A4R3V675_9BURK|nr:tripartite tricarboxylate transporter substrate binding protein BugE [Paracandidimonas soli]TCU99071.1 tripartite-type tricarboxylate transporter receptor subunit TctC [Paracandidimonas soli]